MANHGKLWQIMANYGKLWQKAKKQIAVLRGVGGMLAVIWPELSILLSINELKSVTAKITPQISKKIEALIM
jgi:hypothetical protein